MDEGGIWQAEAVVGVLAVAGALWLVATGRFVCRRLAATIERLTRAGAMALLGVAALSHAAQHWIDHELLLTVVTLAAASGALALGSWSSATRSGSR